MIYFYFAIFFALNFSLWFMLPSFVLKGISKPSRKKKDKTIKNDYIIYGALTILYVFIYLMFFKYFSGAINDISSGDSVVSYFNKDINVLSFVVIIFFIASILLVGFTFYLGKKLFKLKQNNTAYIVISLTGFFNILTYFFSNLILNLNLYAFEAEKYVLNMFLKFDYQMLLFLFPVLVFTNFALSFIEEK